MLRSAKEITGFKLRSSDGEAGTIKDLYFDDDKWTIRYFVVDTGGWLSGRLVLISPHAITGADWAGEALEVNLTKQQIENSPGIDTAKPVSRQHETAISDYYGYPYHWSGPHLWGVSAYPAMTAGGAVGDPGTPGSMPATAATDAALAEREQSDPQLRTYAEVVGYDIQALDDTVGHVEDFLIDDRDWSIQLMVIDTRNWLPGKDVLISPKRIVDVSWLDKTVTVKATRDEVEGSPEYDPAMLTSEVGLRELYRQTGDRTSVTSARAGRDPGFQH